jgi:hypothetical protein
LICPSAFPALPPFSCIIVYKVGQNSLRKITSTARPSSCSTARPITACARILQLLDRLPAQPPDCPPDYIYRLRQNASTPRSLRIPEAASSLFALVLLSLRHFISCLSPQIRWMVNNPLREDAVVQEGRIKSGMSLRETTRSRGFMFWMDIAN